MKKIVQLRLIIGVFIVAFSNVYAQIPGGNKPAKSTYSFSVFKNPNNTFGYDIFDKDKKLIHQPTVPGRPGNSGFKSKADAEKVAKLAISKITKGIMPPTIEENEFKNLNL